MGHTNTDERWHKKPKKELPHEKMPNKACLARQAKVEQMHRRVLEATCAKRGVLFLENHHKTVHKHLTVGANRVVEGLHNKPIKVLLNTFAHHTELLPKNIAIGLALQEPIGIHMIAKSEEAPYPVPCSKEGGGLAEAYTEKFNVSERKVTTDWREATNFGIEDDDVKKLAQWMLER